MAAESEKPGLTGEYQFSRTRIKMCGFTRSSDVLAAVAMGVDALGFVLYPSSPRSVSLDVAARLSLLLPAFVSPVLLFVNPTTQEVNDALARIPSATLQFHGDETSSFCEQFQRPYIRAARIPAGANRNGFDLFGLINSHPLANAILLDTYSDQFGGSGHVFDWTTLPATIRCPIILSGGLSADNVVQGISTLRQKAPLLAVDVSSGIESGKGIKNTEKMLAFVQAVHQADRMRGVTAHEG